MCQSTELKLITRPNLEEQLGIGECIQYSYTYIDLIPDRFFLKLSDRFHGTTMFTENEYTNIHPLQSPHQDGLPCFHTIRFLSIASWGLTKKLLQGPLILSTSLATKLAMPFDLRCFRASRCFACSYNVRVRWDLKWESCNNLLRTFSGKGNLLNSISDYFSSIQTATRTMLIVKPQESNQIYCHFYKT